MVTDEKELLLLSVYITKDTVYTYIWLNVFHW